ncbi:MAG: helicase-related protein [Terriglobia bacterium]
MPELHTKQLEDARTMAGRRAGCLWYEPGLGKTPTGIGIAKLRDAAGAWSIVTVRDAIPNWERELATWAPGKKNISLTHYEALRKPEVRDQIAGGRVILFDEPHVAREIDTEFFRNSYAVTLPAPGARQKSVYLLDGSPVYNGVKDLAAPLILAGVYDLNQYNSFLWRYTDPQPGNFDSYFDYSEPRNLGELAHQLRQVGIHRTYADMGVYLPPLYPARIDAVLSDDDAGKEYRAAAPDFAAWYRRTRGQQLPPLAQFTTQRRMLSLAKVPTAAARVRYHAGAGGGVLCFTAFRESAERLHKQFPGSSLVLGGQGAGERAEIFSNLGPGTNKGLVFATMDALAAALNLQSLNRFVYVDKPWTPAAIDQTLKRGWRQKQSSAVNVDFIELPNDPIEEHGRKVLLKKTDLLIKLGLAPTGNLRQISF